MGTGAAILKKPVLTELLLRGGTRANDNLPKRLTEEPLADGPAEGLVVDIEPLLDAYYDFRGWDKATGKPTFAVLIKLGLEKLI